jgi:DNA helicase-2/ATP-dependent DNA helicase PcrA
VRTLETLQATARAAGASLWQAAGASGKNKGLSGFVGLIESLRADTQGLPLAEVVTAVVERSGLIAHYQGERDGADRIENLRELSNAAIAFAVESDSQDLTAFLAHAALEAGEHEAAAHQDAVQLMTVHAAKGLEFHTVFITGLEEGLFPHEQALTEADGLEEERRLMYVAITRARRRLYLTHAQSRMLHGQPRYGLPSRFLDEIPAGLIQSIRRRLGVAAPAAPIHAAARAAEARYPYAIGSRVRHARYGEGVVAGYQGAGPEAEIRVSFPKFGDKWFILEYVRLTAC